MYKGDLHVHTHISDGSMGVHEVLKHAKEIGLTHIAFTDHDTTKCAKKHVQTAETYGIAAVPGVEMSAWDQRSKKKVHILGYGYRQGIHIDAIGHETLKKRDANCRKQIHILKSLGYIIPVEEVEALADDYIYKQHILRWLYDSKQTEALFGTLSNEVMKNGGPCDFDIDYPEATEVIQAIRADGGVAVLAHPGQQDVFELVPKLVQAGLGGIEYNHHSHGEIEKKKVKETAKEFGLFLTGGSDFHGIYERGESPLGSQPAPEESICLF